jgi:hypothetical protein
VKPKLPDNFEETTWTKLQDAVSAVHCKRPPNSSLEELYRVGGIALSPGWRAAPRGRARARAPAPPPPYPPHCRCQGGDEGWRLAGGGRAAAAAMRALRRPGLAAPGPAA